MSTNGRYTALAKVADGGMAEIFLAVQRGARGFERKVILKRVRAEVAQDSELLKALHDEARIAMGLTHSNIAQVLDVGEAQGRTFLVLELVDGWSLSQVIRRANQAGQPIPWAQSLFIAAQLCRALAHAHTFSRDGRPFNIVHRDLSPQNVLVSAEAEVKLTDFGIARAESREVQTKVGLVKGKPAYMSPEQARGEPLDARSDLFSLGVMLYELCAGVLPFRGANDYEVLLKVQADVFEPPLSQEPNLPLEVGTLIMRSMAKQRDERFASAEEMLVEIERVQRALFGGSGQTELKAYLSTLAAIDGQRRLSERVLAPVAEPGSAEFISDVELLSAPTDVPPPVPPPLPLVAHVEEAPRPKRRTWPWLVGVGLAAGGAWFALREAPPPSSPVAVVVPDAPAVVAVVPDAGGDGEVDAGQLATESLEADAAVVAVAEDEALDGGDEVDVVSADASVGSLTDVASAEPEPEPVPEPVAAPEAGVPVPVPAPVVVAPRVDAGVFSSVRIVSIPAGASVRVERTTFGVAPISVRFRQGLIFAVTLSLPGYEEASRRFEVRKTPGQVITVRLVKKSAR